MDIKYYKVLSKMLQPRLIYQSATVIFIKNEIIVLHYNIICKCLSSNELASIDMHRRYKVMLWHIFSSLHRNLVMLVLLTSLTKSIENL